MIYAAITVFALAALLGLINLKNLLAKTEIPKVVIYSHGLFAATGLVLLIIYACQSPAHYPMVSIILFATAALGGFYMFFRGVTNKGIPLALAVLHGSLAVAGFVMLLFFVFF